jgi:hypothetical protein
MISSVRLSRRFSEQSQLSGDRRRWRTRCNFPVAYRPPPRPASGAEAKQRCKKDTTTLACQQQRKRRTGASGINYDYVIHEERGSRDFAMREIFISANLYHQAFRKVESGELGVQKTAAPIVR